MAQRAGQARREEKLLGLRADLQVGGRGFGKFSQVFYNFFGIFLEFSAIFLEFSAIFLENFPKIFCNFFRLLRFPYDFSENFSENSRSQSVTVQPRSRHYCKFTSKFTPKFTPILIKILQSTKFEDSHFYSFYSFLATFIASQPLSQPFATLCPLPKPFPLFVLFPSRYRVFSTIAPPFQRPKRPSLPLRRRRYVGNTRDYKQDYKSYCKSAYESATGVKAHEKPRKTKAPFRIPPSTSPLPHSANFQILISQIVSILISQLVRKLTSPLHYPLPSFFPKKFQILISILISQPTINLQKTYNSTYKPFLLSRHTASRASRSMLNVRKEKGVITKKEKGIIVSQIISILISILTSKNTSILISILTFILTIILVFLLTFLLTLRSRRNLLLPLRFSVIFRISKKELLLPTYLLSNLRRARPSSLIKKDTTAAQQCPTLINIQRITFASMNCVNRMLFHAAP